MTMAYNFRIIEDCTKCAFRENRLFCDLPGEALAKLQDIKATAVYPKGAMLCLEGSRREVSLFYAPVGPN